MKRAIFTGLAALVSALTVQAQGTHFYPGHLAVLRAGDGVIDLKLRQAPLFIDDYATSGSAAAPSFTARIPTNGPNCFFFNGHAASEGELTLSPDKKLLCFGGYGGVDLLQVNGTASRLDIQRGICTVDATGAVHTYLYKLAMKGAKANPRGVVTDGAGNFWGCGNANGAYFFNPTAGTDPVRFTGMPSSRAIEIIHDTLYVSMDAADGILIDKPAGIYRFTDALPRQAAAAPQLIIASAPESEKTAGFAVNPAENIAYMADTSAGIQKFVKSGDGWKLDCKFSIPQTIPAKENNAAGCFGLLVDFSGTAPVLYATTTEGYDNSVNSNRVVRIVDSNANAVVSTLIQAGSTNIALRGLAFAPN
jgi:hypothetical protein